MVISHIRIVAAIAALKDSVLPFIGMVILSSQSATCSGERPFPSFPISIRLPPGNYVSVRRGADGSTTEAKL